MLTILSMKGLSFISQNRLSVTLEVVLVDNWNDVDIHEYHFMFTVSYEAVFQ